MKAPESVLQGPIELSPDFRIAHTIRISKTTPPSGYNRHPRVPR